MAANPSFATVPRLGATGLASGNTGRDGSGVVSAVLNAGASGTRISELRVTSVGPTSAGTVRFYLHDGVNYRLWVEMPITAVTPSGATAAFCGAFNERTNPDLLPIVIPPGWSVRAHADASMQSNVFIFGADL